MREIIMTISERIFDFMEKRGMSQIEFSEKTGIPQSTISDWKRKKTNPTAEKLTVICSVLDITPNELLLEEVAPYKNDTTEYLIVTRGTERYELLAEFDKMGKKEKERLLGYMAALTSVNEASFV